MKRILKLLCLLLIAMVIYPIESTAQEEQTSEKEIKLVDYIRKADREKKQIVDHTQFDILKKDFKDAHELTATCLTCHNGRHKEILESSHFLWSREQTSEKRGTFEMGKRNAINNFCIGIAGSEKTCVRCHAGYGWNDKDYDFTDPNNIDCLVCHDQTGTYEKAKGKAGYPLETVDLNFVATNVGLPLRYNCGVCHFWGGGGNNVKHGDLDKAMNDCSREVDVHMTTEGENMDCIECHKTENHNIPGQAYSVSSENRDRITCVQCHTNEPHEQNVLNNHQEKIACQTCHIPIYAKANPTKMQWDWSTVGRLGEHGERLIEPDAYGGHKYYSHKGTFVYRSNVKPEYFWFDGTATHTLVSDTIDATSVVQINSLGGCSTDGVSKIWPVKVHRGKQPYDIVHKTLIQPKLWDKVKGNGALWLDYDWDVAAQNGMDYLGLPYSGQWDFIETEMYWPLNHQVSPASQALTCKECHTSSDEGRLANMDGFYIPGRDRMAGVEYFGYAIVILSLLGVVTHAVIRMFFAKPKNA